MGEGPAVSFVSAFRCPHCGAGLESREGRAGAWVRCPGCGRASRAPGPVVRRAPKPVTLAPGEELHRIAAPPEPKPMTPVAVAVPSASRSGASPDGEGPISIGRFVCGAGLFVSATGLLFSFLEQAEIGIVGFSVAAVGFVLILVRIATR